MQLHLVEMLFQKETQICILRIRKLLLEEIFGAEQMEMMPYLIVQLMEINLDMELFKEIQIHILIMEEQQVCQI